MKRYRTSYWQMLRNDTRTLEAKFAKHLRECARPCQIAYQQLMSSTNGHPEGVECKRTSTDSWAFILPDVNGDKNWRIQYFDADGFSGHSCFNAINEAAEALIKEGFRSLDIGALDLCSSSLRWAIGVKRSEIRLLFNMDKLSWREMLEKMQAVTAESIGWRLA